MASHGYSGIKKEIDAMPRVDATQDTDYSSEVTTNGRSGIITMGPDSEQVVAGASVRFTVINDKVDLYSIVMLTCEYPPANGEFICSVSAVRKGSYDIDVRNIGSATSSNTHSPKIHYLVIN